MEINTEMEEFHNDNTFLARWIAGELNSNELEAFKKSKAYSEFNKINLGAKMLKAPSFDQQGLFNRLQDGFSKETPDGKVVKMIPSWIYTSAAVVIIAFGIFFFTNNKSTNFETGIGEQLTVELPDNSKVHLNANSSLTFSEKNWKNNRVLKLEGEAFFDVEKGTTFKAISSNGSVEVLGTEFNVVSRDDFFEVLCHEGKVRVSDKLNKGLIDLSQGKAIRLIDNNQETWSFEQERPNWLIGESSFMNTPLKYVIDTFENQYKVNFNTEKINVNTRFTGSFTHEDMNLALKTVFTPLNISYFKEGKTIVLTPRN